MSSTTLPRGAFWLYTEQPNDRERLDGTHPAGWVGGWDFEDGGLACTYQRKGVTDLARYLASGR